MKEYEEKNARIAASQKSVYSYHHQQRSLSPGAKAALLEYEKQRDHNRRQQMRPPREFEEEENWLSPSPGLGPSA